MESRRTHLLILGRPRSGTTLLTEVLDAQDDVTVRNDFLAGPLIQAKPMGGFDVALTQRQRDIALSMAKWNLRFGGLHLDVTPQSFSTLGELYRCSLEAIALPGDSVTGHKVTMDTEPLPLVLTQTDVRCIYVIRDIRDVVLSASHWATAFVEPRFETSVEKWRRDINAASALRDHPRLVVLRYEDLVDDPQKTLSPVEELLEMRLELSAAGLCARKDPWPENSSFHDVDAPFSRAPLGRWRNHLSSEIVRYAAWACHDELELLGYPPFPDGTISVSDRIQFVKRRLSADALRGASLAKKRIKDAIFPPFNAD